MIGTCNTTIKRIAIVHDNGANIVAAAKTLGGGSIDGTPSAALAKPCNWWSIMHWNTKALKKMLGLQDVLCNTGELACKELRQKQQRMGTTQPMLVYDVTTRWNCTMLSDSAVTQRGKQYLGLKAIIWVLLSTALKPFEFATVLISGGKYTSLWSTSTCEEASEAFGTAAVQAFTATKQLQQWWKIRS